MRWNRRTKLLLVTGGSGFVGRHLLDSAARGQWDVVAPSSSLLDIRSAEQVLDLMRAWKPTAVVHLAYRKDDARTIVVGTANIATATAAVGARLVHVSSDVVFAGRPQPYLEDDELTPVTDYGRWKAQAEHEVATLHPGAAILRTSLVYGSSRLSPIQTDVEQAVRGRSSMRFHTDEIRCPIHATDLALALSSVAARPDIVGLLHLAGPQPLSRADFAREVATWMGLSADAVPTSTIARSGLARPACVVLDSSRAMSLGITARPLAEALRS